MSPDRERIDPYADWYRGMALSAHKLASAEQLKVTELRIAADRARERHAERARAAQPQPIRCVPLPMPPTARDCRRWSAQVAREHFAIVEERDVMPPGAEAFSDWRTRTIVVKPFEEALSTAVLLARVATRAHEFGHLIAGACPETPPHYRNAKVTNWWHCVPCESTAWENGMRLVVFEREMFRSVKSSLAWYLRNTPAHPPAVSAARAVASDAYYARTVQARHEQQVRLDQYEEMQRAATEARRPRRPMTQREQQYEEMRKWAREARQQ